MFSCALLTHEIVGKANRNLELLHELNVCSNPKPSAMRPKGMSLHPPMKKRTNNNS